MATSHEGAGFWASLLMVTGTDAVVWVTRRGQVSAALAGRTDKDRKPPAPVAFAQFRKLHLDTTGLSVLDPLHDDLAHWFPCSQVINHLIRAASSPPRFAKANKPLLDVHVP